MHLQQSTRDRLKKYEIDSTANETLKHIIAHTIHEYKQTHTPKQPKKDTQTGIRVDDTLYYELKAVSKEYKETISNIIEECLNIYEKQ